MSKIVDRTLDFIELFVEQKRPLSLSEIARFLDIPVSSCHDVLWALIRRGYIYEVAARAGFYPTVRLLKIAQVLVEHDPILLRAELVVDGLGARLHETVALAKASGLDLSYVLVRESDHQLRFSVREGDRVRSLHATSAGKCLLGALERREMDSVLRKLKLVPLTPRTIVDRTKLSEDIAVGNARGWFLNDEESALDAQTLSSRFTWGDSIYVLTVAGPKSRIAAKRDEIARSLLESCETLSLATQLSNA